MSNNPYFIHDFFSKYSEAPPEEVDKAMKLFYPVAIKKGEYFVRNGEYARKIGLIQSGLFRYYYIDKKGVEYTKGFAAENHFVISYSSMLLNQPSGFSIQALEDSHIYCINYTDWLQLLEGHPCWQVIARKTIEKVYVMKETREREFLLEDAKTRYQSFLESYPGLSDRIKQYHIASYLGISPVSLSRIRKKLKK
ncbi:Crp/Fnr family transcriptional regulator [Lachnospiraceae bacterium MD1]|uniref:Crp/Fnr family transcriptional regulator n=1 Tax=Variimorphobacter saccharofermentans TaxID=2755051 RepID=A0A839JXX0_9FIRM|nr:Crp/Fnr family transcriptional regulator [Variimorphobacter saccharofermentans]MBB2181469.1 Crp/Fnr family transcriptional regulator [Variimorphobacter saccharofermentans]